MADAATIQNEAALRDEIETLLAEIQVLERECNSLRTNGVQLWGEWTTNKASSIREDIYPTVKFKQSEKEFINSLKRRRNALQAEEEFYGQCMTLDTFK